jgi:hypothetical protein
MGFTTGIVSSMGIGTPHYYIESGGNQWDANTYCTIIFDGSGSMTNVITALTDAMGGDYFSSGSAATGDGVKNVNSIRSTVQDYYATGGIEGAGNNPVTDYNTNNATNGKDEFEKHVQMVTSSEASAYYLGYPYRYNSGATWPASPHTATDFTHTDFVTPSNFIQVVVCNESAPGYHDDLAGSTWANTEITTDWKDHISRFKNAVGASGLNANGYTSGQPTSMEDRADGYKASLTMVLIDPGMSTGRHDGPDVGFGFGSTASQRLWKQGALLGLGSYALDGVTSGHAYNILDFQTLTAWNVRDNAFILDHLYNESGNSSVSFWKARLLAALQQNINV